jgi:hypothetical protein
LKREQLLRREPVEETTLLLLGPAREELGR